MLIEKIIWVHSAHHNIYRDIVLFSRSWMNCREKLAKKVEQWTDAPNVVGGKKMLPMDYPNFREKYVQPTTHTVDARLIFQIHEPLAQSDGSPTSRSSSWLQENGKFPRKAEKKTQNQNPKLKYLKVTMLLTLSLTGMVCLQPLSLCFQHNI